MSDNDKLNFKPCLPVCLLLMTAPAYCEQNADFNILVNASNLKSSGYLDGQTGSVNTDLNGDGKKDVIEYTYANTTPPGTCDGSDCMSELNNSPVLTFHNGKSIDGSYMCTSLGVSHKNHKGMKAIFCGPEYILL